MEYLSATGSYVCIILGLAGLAGLYLIKPNRVETSNKEEVLTDSSVSEQTESVVLRFEAQDRIDAEDLCRCVESPAMPSGILRVADAAASEVLPILPAGITPVAAKYTYRKQKKSIKRKAKRKVSKKKKTTKRKG